MSWILTIHCLLVAEPTHHTALYSICAGENLHMEIIVNDHSPKRMSS